MSDNLNGKPYIKPFLQQLKEKINSYPFEFSQVIGKLINIRFNLKDYLLVIGLLLLEFIKVLV